MVYSHYELLKAHRHASGQKRTQIEYFFLATAIGYFGGSLDYLPIFGVDLYPYGNFAIALYPIIMTYAIAVYRLMDITVAMEKSLTYLLLLIIIGGPSCIILLAAQETYFGKVSYAFSMILLLTLAVILVVAHRIKFEAQLAIGRTLFKRRFDMYETLSEFSKALVSILDIRSLTEEIVHTLVKVLDIKAASLYLLDREKGLYVLSASNGVNPDDGQALRFRAGDGLPHHLANTQSIVIREELEHATAPGTMQTVINTLKTMKSEVCIPFINKDRLVGFFSLGPRVGRLMYSEDELSLLTALAQNAAIALDNAMLYADLKRSQSVMRRTDRLRSLETIAGGFAHEIRNPLTSIKTFIQLIPERKADQDFIGTFSKVVSDDVARIERLIQEILNYARYMEPKFLQEDLNDIVESCLYFVRINADSKGVRLEKELASDLPTVLLDRQQIKQVLLNLFLNAMDAMDDVGGRLTVKTRRLAKPNSDVCVQVEVTDTGCGISPSDQDHIFDPFYTTKHESEEREGTGLGLTIVHQIIQEHGGYIEVESEIGRGTTFLVNLPGQPSDVRVVSTEMSGT